jgi:hypothetical protein
MSSIRLFDAPRVDPNALTVGESTLPRQQASSSQSLTAGSVRLAYLTAAKTEQVGQVRAATGTTAAAATPTLAKMGVYSVAADGTLTLAGATASDTGLFAATNTVYTRALTAPFTKIAGQRYAFALLVVTGAAMPTIYGTIATSTTEAAVAPRLTGGFGGQTDLPASIAAGSITSTAGFLYGVLLP